LLLGPQRWRGVRISDRLRACAVFQHRFCLRCHLPQHAMALVLDGTEKSTAYQMETIRAALAGISRDLRSIRRHANAKEKIPTQVLHAAKIICCRYDDDQLLLEFLQWRTGVEDAKHKRWVSEVIRWRDTAIAAERELYAAADATVTWRHAAALVAKFQGERSLHGWVHQQNVTAGLTPATPIVLEELSKCGLAGKGRKTGGAHRKHRSHLQFLRRWRKRWKVRQGKIPIGEELGSAELLSKVCT
jgi:hypothetical protein